MSTRVRPHVRHNVSFSGHDYGHEIELERVGPNGERCGAFVVGELSEADLKAIASAINVYLNLGGGS